VSSKAGLRGSMSFMDPGLPRHHREEHRHGEAIATARCPRFGALRVWVAGTGRRGTAARPGRRGGS
jgi:hypothetical protein